MSNRKPRGYWTVERIIQIASKYQTISEWAENDKGAYLAAVRRGSECMSAVKDACPWLRIGANGPLRVGREECKQKALNFKTRRQWELGDLSSYKAAVKYGWLDYCCEHMSGKKQKPANYWTKARCMARAQDFTSRKEWGISCEGSYRKAVRSGWVEECAAHMDLAYGASDADVIYLWRDGDSDLHKIGITSNRVGEQRIGICKATNRMDPQIVLMLKVANARAVEKKLLELGTDPKLDSSIDGYTEFRRLTDSELGQAVSIAYEAALAA